MGSGQDGATRATHVSCMDRGGGTAGGRARRDAGRAGAGAGENRESGRTADPCHTGVPTHLRLARTRFDRKEPRLKVFVQNLSRQVFLLFRQRYNAMGRYLSVV